MPTRNIASNLIRWILWNACFLDRNSYFLVHTMIPYNHDENYFLHIFRQRHFTWNPIISTKKVTFIGKNSKWILSTDSRKAVCVLYFNILCEHLPQFLCSCKREQHTAFRDIFVKHLWHHSIFLWKSGKVMETQVCDIFLSRLYEIKKRQAPGWVDYLLSWARWTGMWKRLFRQTLPLPHLSLPLPAEPGL